MLQKFVPTETEEAKQGLHCSLTTRYQVVIVSAIFLLISFFFF